MGKNIEAKISPPKQPAEPYCCDVCKKPLGPDETNLYDVVEEVGGHLKCMHAYWEKIDFQNAH